MGLGHAVGAWAGLVMLSAHVTHCCTAAKSSWPPDAKCSLHSPLVSPGC